MPTLAELIALRATVHARGHGTRGRFGVSGHALSPLRGRGMEYAESREYSHGDDARHIDWRLTARTGRAHTKLFQAERERLSLIVADTAPALYFGTRVRFKSVQAARAGAIAAWAAVRDGDRIAALRGSLREAPMRAGGRSAWRAARARCTGALVRAAARRTMPAWRSRSITPSACCGPDRACWCWPIRKASRRSRQRRWPALAQHHEVIVLLLTDPLENVPPKAALPFQGTANRIELDLAVGRATPGLAQRIRAHRWSRRWRSCRRAACACRRCRRDAASESWLPLLGRNRSLVA